jgi:hypothetical protein
MKIRDWFVLTYCVILLVGTLVILKRNGIGRDDFMAARDLPVNRRLDAGDVTRDTIGTVAAAMPGEGPDLSAFTGRYVRGHIQRNEMLGLRQTDTVPDIVTPPGHVMVLAPLDGAVARQVNAGQCVNLSGPDKAPVPIAAMLCPIASQPACTAVLDLPAVRLTALTAGGQSLPAIAAAAPCP